MFPGAFGRCSRLQYEPDRVGRLVNGEPPPTPRVIPSDIPAPALRSGCAQNAECLSRSVRGAPKRRSAPSRPAAPPCNARQVRQGCWARLRGSLRPGRNRPTPTLVSTVGAGLYGVGDWGPVAEAAAETCGEHRSANGASLSRNVPVPLPPTGPAPARGSSTGANYDSFGQFLGVVCGESPNPGPAAFPRIAARAARLARDPMSRRLDLARRTVRHLARHRGGSLHRTMGPSHREPRFMVIGITHDPATPYQGAVAMSKLLARARLLTVDGYGHGTFGQSLLHGSPSSPRLSSTRPCRRVGARCLGVQPFQ